jgi:hypothetical protein
MGASAVRPKEAPAMCRALAYCIPTQPKYIVANSAKTASTVPTMSGVVKPLDPELVCGVEAVVASEVRIQFKKKKKLPELEVEML